MTESVLNFGPASQLVGILSDPGERTEPELAVVILNAGIIHRAGPNRIHVRLARRLAGAGVLSFRIDMAGIGDSDGLDTNESVDQECLMSIGHALDLLQERELASRFVLFGLCAGAEYAFRYANRDPRVLGLAGVDPPALARSWKSYVIRLVRAARRPVVWYRLLTGRYKLIRSYLDRRRDGAPPGTDDKTGERVRAALSRMVERNVRTLLIITGAAERRYNYATQLFDLFPGIGLEKVVRVALLPTANHTFGNEVDKLTLTSELTNWLQHTEWSDVASMPEDSAQHVLDLG